MLECWHMFDENFKPDHPKSQTQGFSSNNSNGAQSSKPSRNYLSHKSHGLFQIVNHTLASHVNNETQFVNKVVIPNVWSI